MWNAILTSKQETESKYWRSELSKLNEEESNKFSILSSYTTVESARKRQLGIYGAFYSWFGFVEYNEQQDFNYQEQCGAKAEAGNGTIARAIWLNASNGIQASPWRNLAIEHDVQTQLEHAHRLEVGISRPPNRVRALEFYTPAALAGVPFAQYKVGELLWGAGKKDIAKSYLGASLSQGECLAAVFIRKHVIRHLPTTAEKHSKRYFLKLISEYLSQVKAITMGISSLNDLRSQNGHSEQKLGTYGDKCSFLLGTNLETNKKYQVELEAEAWIKDFEARYPLIDKGFINLKPVNDKTAETALFWNDKDWSPIEENFCTDVKRTERLQPAAIYTSVEKSVWQLESYDTKNNKTAVGTAVAVAPNLLITNCHILDGGATFQIKNSEMTNEVTIAGADRHNDRCILKSPYMIKHFLKFSRDFSDLRIGEPAYAIGNPLGLNNTISEGLISGFRSKESVGRIQTTAAISRGSSGGALVDEFGNLIGITTSQMTDGQLLNFAIPVRNFCK